MDILESYDLELILVIKIKVLQFRSGVELLEQFLHGNKIVPMHAIYGFFGCSYFKKNRRSLRIFRTVETGQTYSN